MASYLLVIGDRAALAWVLSQGRMAFPEYRRYDAIALHSGDELLLYTTRGCFHSPNHDRGRVMGVARVGEQPHRLSDPVLVAGRAYTFGCAIEVTALASVKKGVELAPYVEALTSFSNKRGWMARLRRPLVPLTEADATMLRQALAPLLRPPEAVRAGYLAAGRPAA